MELTIPSLSPRSSSSDVACDFFPSPTSFRIPNLSGSLLSRFLPVHKGSASDSHSFTHLPLSKNLFPRVFFQGMMRHGRTLFFFSIIYFIFSLCGLVHYAEARV
ncbi:hypothetical protein IE53DRAFT_278713 [Violaceomyces palustris]|uniref:Uncharacterized protein n=1 Tax=Violaceomyces palustris TaxID=1673888 RepID=A0ACD0P329_9BASI|nr:hypothetical protein IE53DRAFT_278713 [Violaceomyces palustris]